MSDIKSVIALLCKHLQLSLGSSMKPEYFRLAKYNRECDEVTSALWTTLHVLSRQVAKDMQIDDNFDRYDDVHATKLYFAFMQYPTIEFYGLSQKDCGVSRELLLALGWLLATKDVLNIVVRAKLATSIFGHEYSPIEAHSPSMPVTSDSLSGDSRSGMNDIVNRCGRIGHNVKEIAELINERIKLTTKIHGASLGACGLPHLSVSEIALAKKSFGKGTADYTKKDDEILIELNAMAAILDTHMQWTKKEHVYYDWMVTVIEEHKKDKESSTVTNKIAELSNFLSLLRHVTKKRMHSLKNGEMRSSETGVFEDPGISRFLRTQEEGTEADTWSLLMVEQLNAIEIDVEAKMKKINEELRKMLKSISNCVEI